MNPAPPVTRTEQPRAGCGAWLSWLSARIAAWREPDKPRRPPKAFWERTHRGRGARSPRVPARPARCRVSRPRTVVIVETEAYLGIADRAAHTWNGRRTPRVAPMWGPPGHAYVYRVYGMHDCLNVVTGEAGVPEAVLLRAAVPVAWWEGREVSRRDLLSASGPGRLCRTALGRPGAVRCSALGSRPRAPPAAPGGPAARPVGPARRRRLRRGGGGLAPALRRGRLPGGDAPVPAQARSVRSASAVAGTFVNLTTRFFPVLFAA